MNFVLDDFIKEHKDWEAILSGAPYNIKVSRDGCYVMLKYSQIDSDFSEPLVQAARGVIYREPEMVCVCRPFSKFFNYGEPNAASIDWDSENLSILEKIDGSLIKVWYDQGEWHISTNGTIDAFKAPLSGAMEGSYGELFMEAVRDHHFSWAAMPKNFTHLFELVSPWTRVVIPYEQLDAYYLSSIEPIYGWEDMMVDIFGKYFPVPARVEVNSIEELVAKAQALDWTHEGFVVWDGIDRIKVKSPAYVLAHYGRMNGNLSWESLVQVVLDNEEDEFLSYADEWSNQIFKIKEAAYDANVDAHYIMLFMGHYLDWSRAAYAQKVKEACNKYGSMKYSDFMFKLYDNHELNWGDYTRDWDAKRWVKFLELKEK